MPVLNQEILINPELSHACLYQYPLYSNIDVDAERNTVEKTLMWMQTEIPFVDHLCFFLSCACYAFVCICLFLPCGHLLGKG